MHRTEARLPGRPLPVAFLGFVLTIALTLSAGIAGAAPTRPSPSPSAEVSTPAAKATVAASPTPTPGATKGTPSAKPTDTPSAEPKVSASPTETTSPTEVEAQVTVVNVPPNAWDFEVTSAGDMVTTINLLDNASDPDVGDTLRLFGVGEPGHGTVDAHLDTGIVAYTPEPLFAGDDSFTFTVADDDDAEATATVYIHVNAELHVNADTRDTGHGVPITVDVLENDTPGERSTLKPNTVVMVDPMKPLLTTKHLLARPRPAPTTSRTPGWSCSRPTPTSAESPPMSTKSARNAQSPRMPRFRRPG